MKHKKRWIQEMQIVILHQIAKGSFEIYRIRKNNGIEFSKIEIEIPTKNKRV